MKLSKDQVKCLQNAARCGLASKREEVYPLIHKELRRKFDRLSLDECISLVYNSLSAALKRTTAWIKNVCRLLIYKGL